MKKAASILFISVANIILLAHAVIPHHHHKKLVCLEKVHCQQHINTHSFDATEQDHNHDGNGNFEYCLLQQVVVLPSNQIKKDCDDFQKDDGQEFINLISFISLNKNPKIILPVISIAGYKLNITSDFTSYFCSSSGLRAPPIG